MLIIPSTFCQNCHKCRAALTHFQKGDINVWQFDWGSYPQEFVQIAFYINQAGLCKSRVSPLMVSHTYGTKLTFTAEKLSEAFLVKEFN